MNHLQLQGWPITLVCECVRKQRKGGVIQPVAWPHLFAKQKRRSYDWFYSACICAHLRPHRRDLRVLGPQLDSFPRRRQCPHARNCCCHSNRRSCLSGTAIQNHRHGRRGSGCAYCGGLRPVKCRRLCTRFSAFRRMRFHRHEHFCSCQCAHRSSGYQGHRPRVGCGLSWRRHHRHAGGWFGFARRHRFLLVLDRWRRARRRQGIGRLAQSADWFCLRFIFDFHLRAFGRRHFHQRR